jgi:NAD(P)-dependent dehydrogenase (short-subunit alcohol dehydrogenase family)
VASYSGSIYAFGDAHIRGGVPGLWVSRDQLTTWQTLALPSGLDVSAFWLNPSTGAPLLAANRQGSENSLLFSSVDGGARWTQLPAPSSPGITWVVQPPISAAPWRICGATTSSYDHLQPLGNTLTCSTDAGRSWTARPALNLTQNSPKGFQVYAPVTILALTSDDKLFEDHLFFNLTSAYYATRAALPQMVKQNYGRVIHIGSGYAKMGGGPLAYSAGKHGLIGMMKAMVYQIPPAITVNVLCPGWTDTKLANDYFEGAAATLGTTSQALRAQAESENVQKRIVKPDELGPMAALLASEDGSAITGQVVSVDGGYKV